MKDSEPKELTLKPITAIDCIDILPINYIVDMLIEAATITVVSGQEKIGKTYVFLDLALRMALKRPWLGLETMKDESGKIAWIDLDMYIGDTMRRINYITNGIEESWDKHNKHLFDNFILFNRESFKNAGCVDNFQFFEDSDAVAKFAEYILSNNVKVCFIDNLVQIEGGANENEANAIQQVFSNIKNLRDITQCAFIIIHHTDKNGNHGRGSSAIFSETDLNLQLVSCAEENVLLLQTDGARNTNNHNIAMVKEWIPRISEDGITPLTDSNEHPIWNFKLSKIDSENITPLKNKRNNNVTLDFTSNKTKEAKLKKIIRFFIDIDNAPQTQSAIGNHKIGGRSILGSKSDYSEIINLAVKRGILVKDDSSHYVKYSLSDEYFLGGEENE